MTSSNLSPHADRFFASDPAQREIARRLYHLIQDEPIISPHGHTDPAWFAENDFFKNATDFLLVPDHYILRMLYSQGVKLNDLGVAPKDGSASAKPRDAWRLFAEHYHLFRGTPCRIWMDHVFATVFEIDKKLTAETADFYYDTITDTLQTEAFRPRALLDKFNVAFLATTEGALDPLPHHKKIIADGWGKRVVTTFRPDDVLDPDNPNFVTNVKKLGEITGEDTSTWAGYLSGLVARRAYFREHGATATDHGHPTAATANLSLSDITALFEICLSGKNTKAESELFRAQMLTEMAKMSLADGMTMQIHPGAYRNHNATLFKDFGPDKGADIPYRVTYTEHLKPLLDVVGNETDLTIILFTLDESSYARELAPLAGHYPCLKLGPPWWFHDSLEGMKRFREQTTESAGFYNTAGFNDDTRALLSIPARHDLARRMDCRFLAQLVSEHRLDEEEAAELALDLTVNLARKAYHLD